MLVLRPSRTHGIGVFTLRPIAKGARIQLFRKDDWRFVARPQGWEKKMCEHFGIEDDDGGYHCPRFWNRMSIGWYINHSDRPNVENRRIVFRAARRIRAGEELTVDYDLLEGGG